MEYSAVEVPLVDFYVGEWIDRLDELKTNIDEQQVLAAPARSPGPKTNELIVQACLGGSEHRRRRQRPA